MFIEKGGEVFFAQGEYQLPR